MLPNDRIVTIKEKLPYDYRRPDQPLFYCEEDDTLHASLKAASTHYHEVVVKKTWSRVIEARKQAESKAQEIQLMKSMILPLHQKDINCYQAKIRELLSDKNWASSFPTHAAKRREILTLRYRRMEAVGLLNEKRKELENLRKEHKRYQDYLAYELEHLKTVQRHQKEAADYWEEQAKKESSQNKNPSEGGE